MDESGYVFGYPALILFKIIATVKKEGNFLLFFPVTPAGSGLNREVHPITPVILGAYYLGGEKRSGD
jgi:hypothetical protein